MASTILEQLLQKYFTLKQNMILSARSPETDIRSVVEERTNRENHVGTERAYGKD